MPHHRLDFISPVEVEENGKATLTVRCIDYEGRVKTWTFWYSDIHRAHEVREEIIMDDGVYR